MTATKTGKEAAPVDGGANDNGPLPAKADFETAMEASGFGLFNILLLIVAFPSAMATVFTGSTMSFIFPSAECDLKLTLLDKGTLNAVTYAGMVSSAILWGFVSDTKGRKKLLVFGLLANFVCVLGSALSQSFLQLAIFKYLDGFVISGPFAVLMTYLTELHGRSSRQRVMMLIGIMFSTGTMLLPVLAIIILPNQWDIHIIGLTLHSWQMFLLATAVPSLISCTLLSFFPESPKFLMSQGRNEEAMAIFKTIYSLNKHKPKDTYPIKELVNELIEVQESTSPTETDDSDIQDTLPAPLTPNTDVMPTLKFERSPSKTSQIENGQHLATPKKISKFAAGVTQLRPLFRKPYLKLSLLAYLLNFCILLAHNTMRLWLPQLFASITEFEHQTSILSIDADTGLLVNGTSAADNGISICAALDFNRNRTLQVVGAGNQTCVVNVTPASYTPNLIVAGAGVLAYALAGSLVNLIGVKRILMLGTFTASVCGMSLYWSKSALMTVIIASFSVSMGSIAGTSVITASVSLFPTSLRTMIVSLEMMIGRSGSLIGNIIFPALISIGCAPPFLMISSFMLCGCVISAFLPIKNKSALK